MFCQLGYSQSISPVGILVDWLVLTIVAYLVLRLIQAGLIRCKVAEAGK